ncbi:hypothetical protein [Mycobacteroides abscessus]|uniref:Transmembrane protein n=2 Tax=Mycobacteroides abscessus TaxID=36809 RepID=B1MD83_MYCA9|nr:hypothetical protein [Mycobacteroides abscessus]ALM17290.1 hypothetical protein AOY11_14555 [Mycobacteroides abscessus]AMU46506.1 hypothetical protein A3O00_15680 [Mycobacteroides abscessus]AMU51400.1 hypothetical protein A3O01_15610 [Mycobacteroides abscessus]ANO10081.1 hypothetical protein BAB76_15620 [Mycobacteroides abscessus]ANO19857.1 hypothetical protein BAB78_15910 [Mycobacteroides abscessus]
MKQLSERGEKIVSYPQHYPAAGPRSFQVRLTKHTGMLLMFSTRSYTITGTLEQCEAAYRDAQTHNLAAGWWSFLSILLMNWIAIFGNMGQINQIRRLAAQPPAYQAYPPVGYPQPPYPQYPQTS